VEFLFGSGSELLWWQECARALVIFGYGLGVVRVAGRRMFGKWSALDIIVSVIIGSNLSRALTGNAQLGGTLAATTLLMGLHWVLAHAAARRRWWSRVLEGTPVELGREGRVEESRLHASAVSRNDLDEALRQSGIEHVGRTRLIVLEPSGKIAVLKLEEK